MTVDRQTELEIRRLFFAEHFKRGTIAGQLGVHDDVVRRVIGRTGPSPRSRQPPNSLDPYRAFIVETLTRYPGLLSTRVYDMLVERGYQGSPRTVRRFVHMHRPKPTPEVYVRIETLPGEQSQIAGASPLTQRLRMLAEKRCRARIQPMADRVSAR
jgi:transposase